MIGGMPTRTLVLLPGMDGSDKLFGPLRAAAPSGVDTIAVGYPPGPDNDYADLLPAVRAQLPTDRPFFLLGWSFSGPLALELAVREPQKVHGVVLAATFVRAPLRRLGWLRFALVGPLVWLLRAARRLPLYLSRTAPSQ